MNKASAIKERISYVIPIAVTESTSGIPVLVYEVNDWNGEADLSFGIFFIGLRSGKEYVVGVKVSNDENVIIPLETLEFENKRYFRVSQAPDGERIVSASIKVNFSNVKVESPGIYKVEAALIDVETKEILNVKSSFFDIKPAGMVRDEFR